eukprot:4520234-Lingulodinium_polyedra.AAC.1
MELRMRRSSVGATPEAPMLLGLETTAHKPAGVTASFGESSYPAEPQQCLGLARARRTRTRRTLP